MDELALRLVAWVAAFGAAVLGFAARQQRPRHGVRFVAGLALGAALGPLAWAALHPGALRAQPWIWTDPTLAYTVLPLPLGCLALAPWRSGSRARVGFLAASLGSLPLALAVARLGCLASGCCHGPPASAPWGVALDVGPVPVHPTPLYEAAAWVVVFALLRRLPADRVPGAFLASFALVRLVLTPWRAEPPLGPPVLPGAALAALWLLAGLALLYRPGSLPGALRALLEARAPG